VFLNGGREKARDETVIAHFITLMHYYVLQFSGFSATAYMNVERDWK
jgi:hypothetical protein